MKWDQTHLSNRFTNVTFDRFLGLPHKQLMAEYGETFAYQHQNLCNTLRKVLMRKLLVDQTEATPSTQRKKTTSDVDSLVLNVKGLSLMDRLGVKRRSFNPRHTATDLTVARTNCEERVSVKDRLGSAVRGNNRARGWRVRSVDRMQKEESQHPGRKRHTSRNGYYLPNHNREDPSRGVYLAYGRNIFKKRFNDSGRRSRLYL